MAIDLRKENIKMENLVKELNEFLADLNVFYRKVQNYHWNITGKNFFVIHEKLEEYYDKINEQIDEIAEHILILGKQPLGTIKDYLQITKIMEAKNEKIKEEDVINNIITDYNTLLQKSIKIKEEAEKQKCYETSSMIDEYILEYGKNLWMLNQSKL